MYPRPRPGVGVAGEWADLTCVLVRFPRPLNLKIQPIWSLWETLWWSTFNVQRFNTQTSCINFHRLDNFSTFREHHFRDVVDLSRALPAAGLTPYAACMDAKCYAEVERRDHTNTGRHKGSTK